MSKKLLTFILLFFLVGYAIAQWKVVAARYNIYPYDDIGISSSFFLNDNIGYFGDYYHSGGPSTATTLSLYQTIDGWNTFSTQHEAFCYGPPSPGCFIYELYFFNMDTGYCLAYSNAICWLRFTINGGIAWATKYTAVLGGIPSMYFLNPSKGFFTRGDPPLLGVIYNNDSINTIPLPFSPIDVVFLNDTLGFVSGRDSNFVLHLMKTTDGGLSWLSVFTDSSSYNIQFYFPSAGNGYLITDSGLFYKSVDLGINWNLYPIPGSSRISAAFFVNDTKWYVACSDGIILKTTDGGLTFTGDNSGIHGISKLVFTSDSVGYCVAGSTIYKKGNVQNIKYTESNSDKLIITGYPNPTKSKYSLVIPEALPLEGMFIRVFDSTGRLAMEEQANSHKQTLDMWGYPKGLYLVRVNVGTVDYVGNIVVE